MNKSFLSSFTIIFQTTISMELTDKILKISMINIFHALIYGLKQGLRYLDNGISINKLAHCGIRGTALQWFTSYLTSRNQYVEMGGVSSSILPLSTGVPRGSILRPLLSHIYER